MKMKFLLIVTMFCLSVPAVADVSDKGTVVTAFSPEATWELQFPKDGWELKKNNEKGGTYIYV